MGKRRRRRYEPTYAAGVLASSADGRLLAVSRQRTYKWRSVPHYNYDWGLPAGKGNRGEFPYQTALRELEEETGLTSPSGLHPLLEVPVLGIHPLPLYIFAPLGPLAGQQKTHTPEGQVAWVSPLQLLEVRDPSLSVADVNRYILYWGMGIS